MTSIPATVVKSPFARLGRALAHGDVPYRLITVAASIVLILLVVSFGLMLWITSAPTRTQFGLQSLFSSDWNPSGEIFGSLPFVVGTLLTSLVGLAIALPFSLSIAIFLVELCPPRLRGPVGTMVELLAAIPSVVYGLWGLFAFIPAVVKPLGDFLLKLLGTPTNFIYLPFLSGPFFGTSIFASGVILAIMVVPSITAITRDVLLAVPAAQREASFALGATHSETISKVILPYGMSGILGAIILGLGRALGETMAVTMTVGNVSELPTSLLNPGYTMSSVIANEWGEARSLLHSSALLEIGLMLFATSLLLNVLARLLVWSVSRKNPDQRG